MQSAWRRGWRTAAAAVVVVALAGCSESADTATGAGAGASAGDVQSPAATPAGSGKGHDHSTHSHGGAAGALPPAGDGTRPSEIGYSLRVLRAPFAPDRAGQLRFVIEHRGRSQTRFLVEQTKKMHVYVVRDDLAVFRHVHPAMRRDGTWVGNLTLPKPGDYRVVAEFLAGDEGRDGDHVMLGRRVTVPGRWEPQQPPAPDGTAGDWGVEATVLTDLVAVLDQELRIRLTTPDGEPAPLGEYLGTSAHLTGFHTESGAAVHMHPTATPQTTKQGTELVFHGALPTPGDYVLFLQVSVDGFLHTLPIPVTAH